MSIHAINWAYDQKIKNPQAKFILVTLADYCNKNGISYPSIDTLQDRTGMHRATVIRHLQTLINQGYITKEIRPGDGSGRKYNIYHFNCLKKKQGKVAECDIGQSRTVQRQSRTVRPEPLEEPLEEPIEKNTKKEIPIFTPPPEVNPQAWTDLDQYRSTHKTKKVRDSWTSLAKAKACNLLSPLSQSDQQHCVDMTIANGWQGIFPDRLRSNGNATNQRFNRQGTTAAERNSLHRQVYREVAAGDESTVDRGDI
ncbi:MAG: helix-turn-helix domain-containing protein [Candidatus Thiodiazotropha endolucinida]